MKKIQIRKVSALSIAFTIVLSIACVVMFVFAEQQFGEVQTASNNYTSCEAAARQLEEGSNYLTEEARLAVISGGTTHVSNYIEEVEVTQRREKAVETIEAISSNSTALTALQTALTVSNDLCQTEYYAMRLALEGFGTDSSSWPSQIAAVQLSSADAALSNSDKISKAQRLMYDEAYQLSKSTISDNISLCTSQLETELSNKQSRASKIFSDAFMKLEVIVAIFAIMAIITCLSIRRLVVKPLISYNESIKRGVIFPVIGAAELQNLAVTYNAVYKENEQRQMLIRHQAEHDALTDLLNRGAYDNMLDLYEKDKAQFALILVDVDIFKQVNDTYGHEMGDRILKHVAGLLKTTFRSIDHVYRIGGDEFAVIMVEMTSDLAYTIEEKVNYINGRLQNPEGDMPAVSISVGVAFADRKNPGESMYTDADKALYRTKENGRCGVNFYQG